jgi:transposase
MNTRKKYPKEFKLDAISLVLDQSYTRIEAAKSLGINSTMLGRWVKEHQRSSDGQAFRGNGKLTPDQAEIRQLREENRRLKMEKDILKKATVDSTGQCNTQYWMTDYGVLCNGSNGKAWVERRREIRGLETMA